LCDQANAVTDRLIVRFLLPIRPAANNAWNLQNQRSGAVGHSRKPARVRVNKKAGSVGSRCILPILKKGTITAGLNPGGTKR
jgi:hypothetical protein